MFEGKMSHLRFYKKLKVPSKNYIRILYTEYYDIKKWGP